MRISVIGAGAVGGQVAFSLAVRGYEVRLLDIAEGLAEGKALDIMESAPLYGFTGSVRGSTDMGLLAGSDITVVTAGKARQPGMSREDLLKINAKIARSVAGEIKKRASGTIIIAVTNPLDIMTKLIFDETGFDSEKVMGMAGVLDTSRYKYFISQVTGSPYGKIDAMILGPHGDRMIVCDDVRVSGRPLSELVDPQALGALRERAKNGGKEVVELLKTSSAFIAPAASVTRMVDAISGDTGEVMPCSVRTLGKYGLPDVFIGLPARLGRRGVEEVIEKELTEDEIKGLAAAAEQILSSLQGL
ncbi:MAG: malate dehydrogenase [Elusimicrobia bacterium]|nr:malate dehydrogenase [Elusimicrobiota bacterium]